VVLTLQLAMLGPIVKVPETLFFYRTFPDKTEQARVARQGGIGDAVTATRITNLLESLSATVRASGLSRPVRARLLAEIFRAAYVDDTPMGRVARREIGSRVAAARRDLDLAGMAKYGMLLVVESIRRIPATGKRQVKRGIRGSVRAARRATGRLR
jgi:hypothetical protein